MTITFLGNFGVDFSSETHHVKSLKKLGHTVIELQEGEIPAESVLDWAKQSQLFVWVHTHGWATPGNMSMVDVLKELKKLNIPTVTYHLDLWFGLDRQKDLEQDEFYKHIGHFFTVDRKMADWFNENTEVRGHYLPAGVFDSECSLNDDIQKVNDVIFVGSRGYHDEWSYRPKLIDWLHDTYKDKFTHFGGDGSGVVRGRSLTNLYNATKVVVGDTLCIDFSYPYYFSDRLFETLGRGGFMIFPYIKGIEDCYEIEKEIVTYKFGDFGELNSKINYYLEHDEEREHIRKAGHERTIREHTYVHRWKTILEELKLS